MAKWIWTLLKVPLSPHLSRLIVVSFPRFRSSGGRVRLDPQPTDSVRVVQLLQVGTPVCLGGLLCLQAPCQEPSVDTRRPWAGKGREQLSFVCTWQKLNSFKNRWNNIPEVGLTWCTIQKGRANLHIHAVKGLTVLGSLWRLHRGDALLCCSDHEPPLRGPELLLLDLFSCLSTHLLIDFSNNFSLLNKGICLGVSRL